METQSGANVEKTGLGRALTVQRAGLALPYLGLGVAAAAVWARITPLPRLASWHAQMVLGSAHAPSQYRPLTPYLAQMLRYFTPRRRVGESYYLVRALVTGATLMVFDRYLRTWFSRGAAVAGALCLAAIIPFTYLAVIQESDPINLLVFVGAFWALARRQDGLLLPLVLLGTANRETTALIPVIYLVARWGQVPRRELALRAAALGAAWVLVYGGILRVYGPRDYYTGVIKLTQNVRSAGPTVQVLILFGVMWVLAFIGQRRGPRILRRALWLLPPYLLLHYVVAMVNEVRLFLPFAPVIIPLSWWVLFPEARRNGPRQPAASSDAGP